MDTPTSMSNVVSALQTALNTDAMFTNLGVLIPVVGGVLILLIQLVNYMPFLICLILIMNLICSILWGDK